MKIAFTRLACAVVFSLVPFSALPAMASTEKKEESAAKDRAPIYVDFKSIVVPVIKKNGSTGVIALNVMAEVSDDETKEQVKNSMPKLRDAFIRVLYGNMENNRFMGPDGVLDIDRIKTKLLASAQLVMKADQNPIKDILFQNIAQQAY